MHNSQLCISPIHLGHSLFAPVCAALVGAFPPNLLRCIPLEILLRGYKEREFAHFIA